MPNTEKQIPQGMMEDAKGRFVPVANVHETDKLADALVAEIAVKWGELNRAIAEFKNKTFGDVGAYLDLIFEKYQVKRGGKKGNVQLFTYDGRYKLVVAVAEHIKFGPELKVGEQLIYECLSELTDGQKTDLVAIVNHVFAADADGNLNVSRILSLRRIRVEHPKWIKGRAAINDAIQVVGSKQYMRLYQRNEQGEYIAIPLDVAAL